MPCSLWSLSYMLPTGRDLLPSLMTSRQQLPALLGCLRWVQVTDAGENFLSVRHLWKTTCDTQLHSEWVMGRVKELEILFTEESNETERRDASGERWDWAVHVSKSNLMCSGWPQRLDLGPGRMILAQNEDELGQHIWWCTLLCTVLA